MSDNCTCSIETLPPETSEKGGIKTTTVWTICDSCKQSKSKQEIDADNYWNLMGHFMDSINKDE